MYKTKCTTWGKSYNPMFFCSNFSQAEPKFFIKTKNDRISTLDDNFSPPCIMSIKIKLMAFSDCITKAKKIKDNYIIVCSLTLTKSRDCCRNRKISVKIDNIYIMNQNFLLF